MYWIVIRDIGAAKLANAMGPFKDQGSAENVAKGLSAGDYQIYGPNERVSHVRVEAPKVTVTDIKSKE